MLSVRVRRFGWAVLKLLGRYQEEIIERQLLLDRIATSAMALYSAAAVISKLDSELMRAQNGSEQLRRDLSVGRLYCRQAFRTIDRSLATLGRNDDERLESVSEMLTGVEADER